MQTHMQQTTCHGILVSNTSELLWTRAQLVRACAQGKVAGVAAVNLTVQFVLRDGLSRGCVVRSDGGILRFDSDRGTWAYVEQIHARAEQAKRSPPPSLRRQMS